jgi:hypothetical protein
MRGARHLIAVLLLCVLGGTATAAPFEPFFHGVDLDDFATPGGTEDGFESVIRCTPFAEPLNPTCASLAPEPNPGPVHAGYIDTGQIVGEQRFSPVDADLPELWSDAHRATTAGAHLRIGDLETGLYRVVMLGHNPAGGPGERTFFEVNGTAAGSVQNAPGVPLVVGLSQSVVFDVFVDGGFIDIFYFADPGSGQGGWMNGATIELIPEPLSALLLVLSLGLMLVGRPAWRRLATRR